MYPLGVNKQSSTNISFFRNCHLCESMSLQNFEGCKLVASSSLTSSQGTGTRRWETNVTNIWKYITTEPQQSPYWQHGYLFSEDPMWVCIPSLFLSFLRKENLSAVYYYRTINKMAPSPLTPETPRGTINRGHTTGPPALCSGNLLRIFLQLTLRGPSPRTDWYLEEQENLCHSLFKKQRYT